MNVWGGIVEYEFCHRCCCRLLLCGWGRSGRSNCLKIQAMLWWLLNGNVKNEMWICFSLLRLYLSSLVALLFIFLCVFSLSADSRCYCCVAVCSTFVLYWIFNWNNLAFFVAPIVYNKLHPHATDSSCVHRTWRRARGGWRGDTLLPAQHFLREWRMHTKIDSSDENFILKTLEGIFLSLELDKKKAEKHLSEGIAAVEKGKKHFWNQ